MSQRGEKSRSDLSELLHETRQKSAIQNIEVIESRQNQVDKGRKEDLDSRGVFEALKERERSVVANQFWAVVHLTNGDVDFVTGQAQRKGVPSVSQIMEEKYPFGKYNKNNIVSIEVFASLDDAKQKVEEIRNDRLEEKKREIELQKEINALSKEDTIPQAPIKRRRGNKRK